MKNLRAIIQLFIANTISGFAQGISMLAIPWYFTGILDQTSLFGAIYFSVTVISLFWGLYCGTLIDRFNRKHIFLGETSIGACILLSVAGFGFYVGEMPAFLVALVFATTFFTYNIHYPALYAFVQEISDPKDYSRITSFLEVQGQITTVLAGGIGALLLGGIEGGKTEMMGFTLHVPFSVEAWSIQKVFLMDGCTYLLSFLLILPIRYTAVAKRWKEDIGIAERLKVGFLFLNRHPLIFHFVNLAYFVFVTTMVLNYILMPNFIKNFLNEGAAVYAMGDMAFAGGAVVVGVSIAAIFRKTTTVMGCIVLNLLNAGTLLVLAFNRDLWFFMVAMLLLGVANSGSRILRITYIFNRVPNQVIGRTQSVFQVVNVLCRLFFIGLFSLAFFVDHVGAAFFVFGLCTLTSAGIMAWYYERMVGAKMDVENIE